MISWRQKKNPLLYSAIAFRHNCFDSLIICSCRLSASHWLLSVCSWSCIASSNWRKTCTNWILFKDIISGPNQIFYIQQRTGSSLFGSDSLLLPYWRLPYNVIHWPQAIMWSLSQSLQNQTVNNDISQYLKNTLLMSLTLKVTKML